MDRAITVLTLPFHEAQSEVRTVVRHPVEDVIAKMATVAHFLVYNSDAERLSKGYKDVNKRTLASDYELIDPLLIHDRRLRNQKLVLKMKRGHVPN